MIDNKKYFKKVNKTALNLETFNTGISKRSYAGIQSTQLVTGNTIRLGKSRYRINIPYQFTYTVYSATASEF